MLLAIDTSGATGVAVVDDAGEVLGAASSDDPRGHAEQIGVLIEQALDAAGRPAIDAVAYGTGPGPYTGLRVGMAAARAFALAAGADELPVLSHDAIAATGSGELVVVTDAKRREQYFTVYRGLDPAGLPVRAGEPQVGPESAVPALPRIGGPVDAVLLGRVALLRRAAGLAAEAPDARYLRSADVTLAPRKRVGA